jgi:rhodanese-related sulfurtransferase
LFISTALAGSSARGIDSIPPTEASALRSSGKAVIVDVREPSETASGYAAGAVLMPLSKMEAKAPEWDAFVKSLKKEQTVVVYCRSGRRSSVVAEELKARGFTVKNMGGFSGWTSAGLPTASK